MSNQLCFYSSDFVVWLGEKAYISYENQYRCFSSVSDLTSIISEAEDTEIYYLIMEVDAVLSEKSQRSYLKGGTIQCLEPTTFWSSGHSAFFFAANAAIPR